MYCGKTFTHAIDILNQLDANAELEITWGGEETCQCFSVSFKWFSGGDRVVIKACPNFGVYIWVEIREG